MAAASFLELGAGDMLAYHRSTGPPGCPEVVFCHGLNSTMSGTKALDLQKRAKAEQWGYTRYDNRGHGESSGSFIHCTVGDWIQDAVSVITMVHGKNKSPVIVVGSSIGGWAALHAAIQMQPAVQGLVLLAPAVDITGYLTQYTTPEARQRAEKTGIITLSSEYDPDGLDLKLAFLEEGKQHMLLDKPDLIPITCPVRIIHGVGDSVVPHSIASQLMQQLQATDVKLTLIKDGDHRLSRQQDLQLIALYVSELAALLAHRQPA